MVLAILQLLLYPLTRQLKILLLFKLPSSLYQPTVSSYPEAHDPADNALTRLYYGNPIAFRVRRFKEEHGNFTGAIWVLFSTPKNEERYLANRDDTNPPTTETEALEQAGATFIAKSKQDMPIHLYLLERDRG